jgi:hypothetical protein
MFLLGIMLVPIAAMHLDLSYIPGDLMDGRLNNYFFEHGFKWINGQFSNFWDDLFFYPEPQVMTFSDNHLGTLLIYYFFRILKFDKETSYQLWFLVVFALNYFSAVYVLRKMNYNILGVCIGAYIFAFSLPVSAQLGHCQLLSRFMVPIAFYYTFKFLYTSNTRSLILVCISIVWQFYCSIYLGYFLILCIISLAISYMIVNGVRATIIKACSGSLSTHALKFLTIILSGAALLPLMYPYYRRAAISSGNSWETITTMLPRVQSYFLPDDNSLVWSWLLPLRNTLPASQEHHLFIGLLPLMAFISIPFLYLRYRDNNLKDGLIFFISLIFITVLTLYIGNFTLYKYITFIPGINAIRGVTRICVITTFIYSVTIALVISVVNDKLIKTSSSYKRILFIISVIIILIDQSTTISGAAHYSKSDAQHRTRQTVNEILKIDPNPKLFVYLPEKTHNNHYEVVEDTLDAMFAAQELNIKTINGYTGHYPQDYHIEIGRGDVCIKVIQWIGISNYKYSIATGATADLFKDLIVVGGESCKVSQGRLPTYTFYDHALPKAAFSCKIIPNSYQMLVNKKYASLTLPTVVTNISPIKWPASVTEIGFRWLTAEGVPLTNFIQYNQLLFDIAPGQSIALPFNIETPNKPGKYQLQLDLYQKDVAWFHEEGSKMTTVTIIVN